MKNTIKEIIEKIPNDRVFDAHLIIDILFNNYWSIYMQNYDKEKHTAINLYHSYISKEIAKFEGQLIERVETSYSENIKNNNSNCVCWKRIGR